MHKRQAFREAAVAAVTGLATTGARVFDTRFHPIGEEELPALVVSTGSESIEYEGLGGSHQARRMGLIVRGLARAEAGVEDLLETMLEEVETALGRLAGTEHVLPVSVEIDTSDAGDMPIAAIVVEFEVFYLSPVGSPSA